MPIKDAGAPLAMTEIVAEFGDTELAHKLREYYGGEYSPSSDFAIPDGATGSIVGSSWRNQIYNCPGYPRKFLRVFPWDSGLFTTIYEYTASPNPTHTQLSHTHHALSHNLSGFTQTAWLDDTHFVTVTGPGMGFSGNVSEGRQVVLCSVDWATHVITKRDTTIVFYGMNTQTFVHGLSIAASHDPVSGDSIVAISATETPLYPDNSVRNGVFAILKYNGDTFLSKNEFTEMVSANAGVYLESTRFVAVPGKYGSFVLFAKKDTWQHCFTEFLVNPTSLVSSYSLNQATTVSIGSGKQFVLVPSSSTPGDFVIYMAGGEYSNSRANRVSICSVVFTPGASPGQLGYFSSPSASTYLSTSMASTWRAGDIVTNTVRGVTSFIVAWQTESNSNHLHYSTGVLDEGTVTLDASGHQIWHDSTNLSQPGVISELASNEYGQVLYITDVTIHYGQLQT